MPYSMPYIIYTNIELSNIIIVNRFKKMIYTYTLIYYVCFVSRERDTSDQGIAFRNLAKYGKIISQVWAHRIYVATDQLIILARTWHATVSASPNSQSQTPEERHRSLDPLDLWSRSKMVEGHCFWLCGTGQDHCPNRGVCVYIYIYIHAGMNIIAYLISHIYIISYHIYIYLSLSLSLCVILILLSLTTCTWCILESYGD